MKNKIILYSAWCFIPDKMFENKMKELGYEDYRDINLRLDKNMIKFIEENATKEYKWEKYPSYRSEKADTKGKAGIVRTTAWIGEVDLSQKWTIINGSHPFIGAEEIEQYEIQEFKHNYIILKTIR